MHLLNSGAGLLATSQCDIYHHGGKCVRKKDHMARQKVRQSGGQALLFTTLAFPENYVCHF